ncbi:DUF3800 domain-containing protein [Burkholderia stagnalis]|uniref:DUF3800 domain-containing protein n=1 Tax=Burkholderia stagnalis TaxID=1503054 RepID=A0ABX9YBZ2_9BURK|nr:DUF3800 domain-containing protein [Burkholderia stagnalis]RQQ44902.1 DUF3800 domain-containing protein [Burkholderia stagnalis]RQQ58087.1 DUF3800 domain-containing protein [Burkholderia stagnalis]RQQ58234.1 DUF3800 domain-containing protein [Burkholderia stagnalis]RQQ71567.1 DUF3800 domain-containing protein [Burkholderia stagnalis]RQQ78266.1 DUF3800 domain-containing protein [Burkholderia stagnalis]
MYLSYLDESGSPGDPNTPFFVLGGVAVFERQTHWLERELDAIADRYQQQIGQYLELHAGPMRSGKEGWEKFTPAERAQASADVIRLLDVKRPKVFAAVVEQNQFLRTADVLPYCYEVLATKFDDFLAYRYQRYNDPQRGIFVLDRKRTQEEKDMQVLHQTFKTVGHANGRLRNFAEVPMFADSKSTRLIQLADSIVYWIYRRFHAHDDWGWREIHRHFAVLGNGRTGLHEVLAPATPAALQAIQTSIWPFPVPLAAQPAAAVAAQIAQPAPRLAPGAVITI